MASNTQIQVASLDFAGIKQNFINYLQSQDTFKDYNFSGSAISTLLDVLAYNTQYNAFYLNMVANEMFLDSSLQRSSVVSHAKLLNYVPQSAVGPVALINLTFNGVTTSYFTLPQYTRFMSEAINNINYSYVTTQETNVQVINNQAIMSGIELKQGSVANYTFTVDSTANPQYIFEIPDPQIDVSTLQVTVTQSSSNSAYQIFNPTTDYLSLGPTDAVYFIQEAVDGNYQIYFGDGVLGQQLSDGNIVKVTYISTLGTSGGLANNFTLMDSLPSSFSNYSLVPYEAATSGQDRESIDSIKFQAPKSFSAQGRAVSKNDYITLIQQNNLGIQFDAVSVWGGEENNPPAYGQVFISLKPKGAYDLTATQKTLLIEDVITPISVLTVQPTIVDPDYTYIQLTANVLYQQSQTSLTPGALQTAVTSALYGYAANNLNTFNSTFSSYDVLSTINNVDQSVVTSDFVMEVQKKFYPNLTAPTTYTLQYNSGLKKGMFQSGVNSYPGLTFRDPSNPVNTIDQVFIEEIPTSTAGVDSISIINPGYNYQAIPSITIVGDGTGATATATIINGALANITVTNAGVGYTQALAYVTPAIGDTGQNASIVVNLQGQFGTLRTYYNNTINAKTVLNANVGTIDYINGIITLTNFNPIQVDNPLGELTISVEPTTTIISSSLNRIITIDPYDPNAIVVNITAKK